MSASLSDCYTWRRELASLPGNLTEAQITPVLDACRKRGVKPFDFLADRTNRAGVGLRIDLSRGLTEDAPKCLDLTKQRKIKPFLLFPLASAGDVGYAREGRLILDKQAIELLRRAMGQYQFRLGFLCDPSAILTRTLNEPMGIMVQAKARMKADGIDIAGCGCSFHSSPAAIYDMIWMHMITSGRRHRFSRLFESSFACREWTCPTTGANLELPDCFRPPKDGILDIHLKEESISPEYVRSLSCQLGCVPEVRLTLTFDFIAFTCRNGWRLIRRDGSARETNTAELVDMIASSPPDCRIGCILDPSDIEWENRNNKTSIAANNNKSDIRTLPYPFHHFLSVNSDVDWSLPEHVEMTAQALCDEMGLCIAGSAYPNSMDRTWVSWGAHDDWSVNRRVVCETHHIAGWANEGLIDTYHGLAHSFDTIRWIEEPTECNGSISCTMPGETNLTGYDGILLITSGPLGQHPQLALEDDAGNVSQMQTFQKFYGGAPERCYYLFLFSENNISPPTATGKVTVRNLPEKTVILGLETAYAVSPLVQNLLCDISNDGMSVPICTFHGGRIDTSHYGVCIASRKVSENPEKAIMAMDYPGNPYYILPALRAHGVFFFNPMGWFAANRLCDSENILTVDRFQDGKEHYIFRRFAGKRYLEDDLSARWAYGKSGVHAQGFPANVEDILLNLHWRRPGHGAIIYTHLGHRVGNQVSKRLGWNEEMHSAWARLAEFVHMRDRKNPVPFRIWFAPASSILAFAAIMRHLHSAIERKDHEIHITSWHDSCIGHRIPDPQTFGLSWMHGITLFVNDPTKAQIFIDRKKIEYYTLNAPDALGGPSVTLVDASSKRALIPSPDIKEPVTTSANKCTIEVPHQKSPTLVHVKPGNQAAMNLWPVSLRNITHWTFEVLVQSERTRWLVGFQTADGQWFDAGNIGCVRWQLPLSQKDTWQRYTLSFESGTIWNLDKEESPTLFAHEICGKITAIRFEVEDHGNQEDVLFRDLSIIRPQPTARMRKDQRILSGCIRSCRDRRAVMAEVVCHLPDKTIKATTNQWGTYVLRGLPDNARVSVELSDPSLNATFIRGKTAYMSCNQWDWDVLVH